MTSKTNSDPETSSSDSDYQGTVEDRLIAGIPVASLSPRAKKRKLSGKG